MINFQVEAPPSSRDALQRSVSLLDAALEATTDGLLVVDLQGGMVRFNQRFAELWGLPREILSSRDDRRALAFVLSQLSDPEGFLDQVQRLYARPEASSRDEILFKDGRILERHSLPQRLDGLVVGRVWSFRDVTAARQTERELDRLLRQERAGRQRAEQDRQRWAFLADASRKLGASLDLETTLQTVARLAIPQFADACGVFLVEEGRVRKVVAAHRDPGGERQLEELFSRYLPSLETPFGLGQVYATGEPLLLPKVPDAFLQSLARSPEHLQYLREIGMTSYLAVPLPVGGRVLGVILFAMVRPERRFGPEDVTLAEELARRCAAAVDNARLYRETREAARRWEESLALLDTLFLTAPIGLAFLDAQLRCVRVNQVLAEMHGVRAGEAQGLTVRQAYPWLAPELEPLLRSVLESGTALVGLELSGQPPPGEPGQRRSWLTSIYPVRTARGQALGLGLVVMDITGRKLQEEERERSLQQAREAVQARDEFLSIASHELKTPLTAARLRLQILQRPPRQGAGPPGEGLQLMERQLRFMGALVDQLLDVSRIRSGRMDLRREPGVDLRELAEEVLSLMDGEVRRSGSEVQLRGPGPVRGTWDRLRLQEVVANLLTNALKFGGGQPVQVEVTQQDGAARLRVTDRGPGISPVDQQRVFERFERAVSPRQYGGLGLGLYVVRGIVEAHGGTVGVESRPGEGSSFTVTLPLPG